MEEAKIINGKVAHKHELEKNWLLSSYVPEAGEIVVYDAETSVADVPSDRAEFYNYPRYKVGNGVNSINELPFGSNNTSWYYFDAEK